MGMGVAGMIIASDDWDHSRKFPAFSTSKNLLNAHHFSSTNWGNSKPSPAWPSGWSFQSNCGIATVA